jgi:hypothetical protein
LAGDLVVLVAKGKTLRTALRKKADFVPSPAGLQPAPTLERRRQISAIPASLRHDLIEQAAYARAEARGFAPGGEIQDWLAAEIEVDDLIRARYL